MLGFDSMGLVKYMVLLFSGSAPVDLAVNKIPPVAAAVGHLLNALARGLTRFPGSSRNLCVLTGLLSDKTCVETSKSRGVRCSVLVTLLDLLLFCASAQIVAQNQSGDREAEHGRQPSAAGEPALRERPSLPRDAALQGFHVRYLTCLILLLLIYSFGRSEPRRYTSVEDLRTPYPAVNGTMCNMYAVDVPCPLFPSCVWIPRCLKSMSELSKMEEAEEQGFLEDVNILQTADEHTKNLAILKEQKEKRIA